jgi:hypothetical protein
LAQAGWLLCRPVMKRLLVLHFVYVAFAGRLRRNGKDYRLKLNNHLNVQYSGDFTVGDQPLPVIYDTGSFEVLVLSSLCADCSHDLKVYSSGRSKTFVDLHKEGQHSFASGSVFALEGKDTIKLGDPDSTAEATQFPFWQIKDHKLQFWHTGNAIFSGIVGLTHASNVPFGYGGDPANDAAVLEKMKLDAFSYCLERGPVGATPPGWITFGVGLTQMQQDPHIFWQSVPVAGESHWATSLKSLTVGNVFDGFDTSKLCKDSCGALFDSGTSLLSFPRSMGPLVDKLKGLVKPDCSNVAQLPTLHFDFGRGVLVDLPPKAYIFQVPTEDGQQQCKGAILQMNQNSQFGETFIFGMPFLRYYLTIFDKGNKKLHFTRANEDCTPASRPILLSERSQLNVAGGSNLTLSAGLTQRDYSEGTSANLDDIITHTWILHEETQTLRL